MAYTIFEVIDMAKTANINIRNIDLLDEIIQTLREEVLIRTCFDIHKI